MESPRDPWPATVVPRPRDPGESTEPLRLDQSPEPLRLGESAEPLPPSDGDLIAACHARPGSLPVLVVLVVHMSAYEARAALAPGGVTY